MVKSSNRNINLDLIRIIAIFSVISVHFFLYIGFYDIPVSGKNMIIMTYLRNIFMVCVPLFLVLTGYLFSDKKPTKKYYLKLDKIIFIYIISWLFYTCFKTIYFNSSYNLLENIKLLLDYSWAWYVEMYIGLYILAPFLNIVYNNLESKKNKKILLASFLLLTCMPSIFNIKTSIVIDYWIPLWPITYYFIGRYLKEYGFKISTLKNIILLLISFLIFGSINLYFSYGKTFIWGIYNDWHSLQCVITTVLTFTLILNLNLEKFPIFIKKTINKISVLSFGMYLNSIIFDIIFYNILKSKVSSVDDRLIWYFVMVLSVFVSSMILSQIIEWFRKIFIYFHKNVYKKYERKFLDEK